MKQNVRPSTAIVLAVIAVAMLGLLSFRALTGSSSLPQANPRPVNPTDDRYKPHLPDGVGGGSQ